MEYWWEHVPSETAPDTMPLQVNVEGESAPELQNSSVGETLQKLISIAKLNFTKAKVSNWFVKCNIVASIVFVHL
jgi:hypothetical protein